MKEDKLIPLVAASLDAITEFGTYMSAIMNDNPNQREIISFGVSCDKKRKKTSFAEYKDLEGKFKITVTPEIPKIYVSGQFKDTGPFTIERTKFIDITKGTAPNISYWTQFFDKLFK